MDIVFERSTFATDRKPASEAFLNNTNAKNAVLLFKMYQRGIKQGKLKGYKIEEHVIGSQKNWNSQSKRYTAFTLFLQVVKNLVSIKIIHLTASSLKERRIPVV